MYYKSPFNYIGNKFRILAQIQKWFPKDIDTMVDLFCGGCDVIINTSARRKYANDINFFLIDILKEFQTKGLDTVTYIDDAIAKWHLTQDDQEAYLAFRNHYNMDKKPLDLYVLLCYSFNYQFRFNSKHDYNNPFGRARSSFNDAVRANLLRMLPLVKDIVFSATDFLEYDYSVLKEGDFLYADPPYLLACGSYNDGKRGFRGWGEKDERALYDILDGLSRRGVRFALSNVIEHKGNRNLILAEWKRRNRYHMHHIKFNYDNCNYHAQNRDNKTDEILVTNYV